MPGFKPKANRKISPHKQRRRVTLDGKHNEMMSGFAKIEESTIPNLHKRRKCIRKKLADQKKSFERSLELKDELSKLDKELVLLKGKKIRYLLDNSHHIFGYFERKKNLSGGNNKTKVLHSFFEKGRQKRLDETEDDVNTIQKYLTNVDESYLDINDYRLNHEVCASCEGELIPVDNEGVTICSNCGIQKELLLEHEKPSYKEPPKEVCFYAYKRINHFREILAQFQAKETTQIPPKVLADIIGQVKKERLDLAKMTNKRAKEILKKLGYNKYYEHIPFIKDKLGIKPPIMSQELEETLCSLFMDIQKPYAKHCPDDRVNFLNYYYVLYKMCELLEEIRFIPFFPMLKDPVKRIEQDEIWKKICHELSWEFIQTT